LEGPVKRRLSVDDPYLVKLRKHWGDGMRQLFHDLEAPPFVEGLLPVDA
jgi:predicted proteasome-type protease